MIDEFELGLPRAGEALVAMKASGLCDSNLPVRMGKFLFPVRSSGAEGAGQVEICGGGVTKVKPGDRVITNNLLHYAVCRPCRSGRTSYCQQQTIQTAHFHRALGSPSTPSGTPPASPPTRWSAPAN